MKLAITVQAEVERYSGETLAQFRDRYNVFKAHIADLVDRGILPDDITFLRPKLNFGGQQQITTIKVHRCQNMDCEHYGFVVTPVAFSGVETCPTCSGITAASNIEAQVYKSNN